VEDKEEVVATDTATLTVVVDVVLEETPPPVSGQ
jgi:hypothetical protein